MRHPREWFATRPHIDEDTERPKRYFAWRGGVKAAQR